MSLLFISDDQNTGASASALVLPTSIQGWFSLRLVWSPCCAKDFQEFSPAPQLEGISSLAFCLLYSPALTTIMTTGMTIALTIWTFVGKVMSLYFNMLSRLLIVILPRSKHLLISWLQSPSAVILEPKKIKVSHCFHCFPIYLPGLWNLGFLHCRQILYHLSHQGSPCFMSCLKSVLFWWHLLNSVGIEEERRRRDKFRIWD